MLLAADGYFFKGKRVDTLPRLAKICAALPSVKRTVVVPYTRERPDLAQIPRVTSWGAFLGADGETPELLFERLPFDHPLYIMYSSGTTGPPKCIVHGAGGTLLQHLKEHRLHTDLGPADTIFYFTTCGWMMWNWLVSGLASGATLVLYDGSPFHPGPEALWRVAEEEGGTVFGTSAK